MDSLFHFVISLAGGFMFLGLARTKYDPLHLFALSFLSLFIDIQHLFEAFYLYPVFHAIYFALLPLVAALYFHSKNQPALFSYSVLLSVMLFGHLFADMIQGMHGVPLLYPFSTHLFMLPWALLTFRGDPVIGAAGIAMALYFGLVFLSANAVVYLRPRK